MINIKTNSKKVKEGDIFVAIKGFTVDGHSFIASAVENGAKTIVYESGDCSYPGVESIKVLDTKKYLHDYLLKNYKGEINKMRFIGVTGTNGKTTTCFLTYELLNKILVNTCYIGTIGYYDRDSSYELPNTTPAMIDLYDILLSALDKGISTVVMEVSSHSLVENRIDGILYDAVGFTNLTQDHLDFHGTMENYYEAKLGLLDHLKDEASIIVNNDDEYFKKIDNVSKVSYGFNGFDLKILDYQDTYKGSYIKFLYNNKVYEVNTLLKNRFNVYNYLMSVLLVSSLGYELSEILAYSEEICPPHGRCERVMDSEYNVIVDYAHTPDAVLKIISSFKENNKGKVLSIIGCGGDRDKEKRPIMGSIATENSDFAIITTDNPRTEDPDMIIEDILAGITKDNYKVIKDRREAIIKGIDMLGKDDTLLILGKGHENYQIIGHDKHHFDDLEIAHEYIKTKKIK